MLRKMQAGAQSLGAKIVAGVICFVLVVFGFGAFNLFAVSAPAAAVVNGEDITETALTNATNLQRRALKNQWGDQVDDAYVESVVTESYVLRLLVNRLLLKQKADEISFVSSKTKFLDRLQSNPSFQQDGEFDPDQFGQVIARSGYSPQTYEATVREDFVIQAMFDLYQNTSFLTDKELYDNSAIALQTRDIAYLQFNASLYEEKVEVSEEDIEAYYEENPDSYMSPEEFEFSYVLLDRETFEAGLSVTQDEIVEQYEAEKIAQESESERRASHILLSVDDSRSLEDATRTLLDVRKRVQDGESFAEIAEEMSDDFSSATDGGDLGFNGRGVFVPEFENVLFSLEVGEMSDPVETQFGVHLIQLNEIQEIIHETLEERRPDIVVQLIAEKATPAFEEALAELDKITFEQPDSLEAAAQALGLEIQTQAGVTRQTGEGPLSTFNVRSQLMVPDVIENGFNSRPIEVSDTERLVGRMVARDAPTLLPLEEVRSRVETLIKTLEAQKRAEAVRDEALAKLQEDFDFSAIADEYGVEWTTFDGITRDNTEVPYTLVQEAFDVRLSNDDEREVLPVNLGNRDRAILVVSSMNLGDYSAAPQSDQTVIVDTLQQDYQTRNSAAVVDSLRSEASIRFLVQEQ